jgi:NMD protein affecting ribosome stability and mRNA decay
MIETIYNGSVPCPECGRMLTPVEALWGRLCPSCAAIAVQNLVSNKMVAPTEGNQGE